RQSASVRSLIALAAIALAGSLGPVRPAAAEPGYQPSIEEPLDSASASLRFRLGTAAAPFGWATALGDFNNDGKPDIAVADRIRSAGPAYEFDVEVAVSNERPQHLSVAAPYDAIAVVVDDIDDDADLDIVVTPAPTRDVLAAWLNDGSGHFVE